MNYFIRIIGRCLRVHSLKKKMFAYFCVFFNTISRFTIWSLADKGWRKWATDRNQADQVGKRRLRTEEENGDSECAEQLFEALLPTFQDSSCVRRPLASFVLLPSEDGLFWWQAQTPSAVSLCSSSTKEEPGGPRCSQLPLLALQKSEKSGSS